MCSIYVAIGYKHAMFKYYQYAINDFKVCGGMQKVSIIVIHFSLQKNEQRLVEIQSIALEN